MDKAYINAVRKLIPAEKKPLAYTCVHGCAQNEADMEKIRGMLEEMGYGFTDTPKNADIIIVNTCAVREGAEFRIYGNVGSYKKLKKANENLIITVCGCMMQQPHVVEKMKKSYPYVDIIFGTHNIHNFPKMLCRKLETGKRVIEVTEKEEIVEGMPIKRSGDRSFSTTVMYGCNNFCSYCIVPYTRGRERSRKPEDIIREITEMAEKGYVEVTLIGQNVNSYGKDLENKLTFAQLLRRVNEVKGIKRIKFITSHPKDLSDELIDAMAECENVCEYLHLPFQAGSDRILKLMNRKYTKEQYLELVRKVKEKIPGIALTADVIVGFPGETDEDFAETMDIIEKVRFDGIFSFIYSRRKGTPAAEMPDVQTDEEKHRNFDILLERQKQIGLEINESYKDRVVEVLVEGRSKSDSNMLSGRTRTNKIVHFKGDESLIGNFVDVKIDKILTFYMSGEMINKKG